MQNTNNMEKQEILKRLEEAAKDWDLNYRDGFCKYFKDSFLILSELEKDYEGYEYRLRNKNMYWYGVSSDLGQHQRLDHLHRTINRLKKELQL